MSAKKKQVKIAGGHTEGFWGRIMKIPLRTLIMIAFTIINVQVIVQTGFAIYHTHQVSSELNLIKDQALSELLKGTVLREHVLTAEHFTTLAALRDNEQIANKAQEAQDAFYSDTGDLLSAYQDREGDDTAEAFVTQLQAVATDFNALIETGDQLKQAVHAEQKTGQKTKVDALTAKMDEVSDGLLGDLSGLSQQQQYDMQEHMESLENELASTRTQLWVMIGMVTLINIIVQLLFGGALHRRIGQIVETVDEWATGLMTARIYPVPCEDDLGKASHAVNRLADNIEAFLMETGSSLEALRQGIMDRRIDVRGLSQEMKRTGEHVNSNLEEVAKAHLKADAERELIANFKGNIGRITEQLSGESAQVETRSQTVAAAAEESSRQAEAAKHGSEEASSNVATVAAAAEELSASIAEETRQIKEAQGIIQKAVVQAEGTTATVESLGAATNEIGQVVQLISDIAEQTNLLALNASIEAARAGDAGRGFAVVAGEVKDLANQTAEATDRISRQIGRLQKESTSSSEAITNIAETIGSVGNIVDEITGSADEQATAAQEISASVQHANMSVGDVVGNVTDVSSAAEETGQVASDMLAGSQTLKASTEELAALVQQFLSGLADAGTKQA